MYYPFKKLNDEPTFINTKSNHPPNIIKQIPASISRRISDLSCNKEVFERAKPYYDERLKSSGYREELSYTKTEDRTNKRKNRKRKIIWFDPPFSKNVQTNIGKVFLRLLDKHFPKNHKFHKIFNKNTVKVSYNCMENMASIIKRHNRTIIGNNFKNTEEGCNCRDKNKCPLENKCLSTSLVYKACVYADENTEVKNYIGLTEGTFKQRFNGHHLSFRNKKYANSTELSKHIWKLKNSGKDQNTNMKWSIITKAASYNNGSKR